MHVTKKLEILTQLTMIKKIIIKVPFKLET